MPKKLTEEQERAQQCTACPLLPNKISKDDDWDIVDILVITDKRADNINAHKLQNMDSVRIRHTYLTECTDLKRDSKTKTPTRITNCCVGRKLSMIEKMQPKLIITSGNTAFKELESLFVTDTKAGDHIMDVLLPTEWNGQKFWHLSINDNTSVRGTLRRLESVIEQGLVTAPTIVQPDTDNIVMVLENDQIAPAFEWLAAQSLVALDIETTGFKPYGKHAKILTLAIGTQERVYVFPLLHPGTPAKFEWADVFSALCALPKTTRIVAHNLVFELEWLGSFLGFEFLYQHIWEDTMAQAYLLGYRPMNLGALTRRHFGFNLKTFSDVDVSNLIACPLEKVMLYNALDVKYTHKLFEHQEPQVLAQGLEPVYRTQQVERIPSIAAMQLKGLELNEDFIRQETHKVSNDYEVAMTKFQTLPEVQDTITKYGKCDPFSRISLKHLFHDVMKVSVDIESFDKENLHQLDSVVAETILEIRGADKLYSTYLLPLNKEEPEGGKFVHDDGLIHASFTSMFTATGRLSAREPNVQNYPSRGGQKYLRNVVKAPDGHVMVAIDMAQIEYRIIATLSKDPEMIKAIIGGHDVHMHWAKRVAEYFPKLIQDKDDPKQMKELRSRVKNQFVFPLCYGAGLTKIAALLGVIKLEPLKELIKEFHDFHQGISPWQEQLKVDHDEKGFITSPFGRKFYRPLQYNEIINFGVQSTASDIVVSAQSKLARIGIEENMLELVSVLNIHDDAGFYFPEDRVNELVELAAMTLCDTRDYKDWLFVPLEVEVSAGKTWGNQIPIGRYENKDFGV